MRLDDFDFELPRAAIAQHPVTPRDSARLLVVGDRVDDRHVRDLPDLLRRLMQQGIDAGLAHEQVTALTKVLRR